MESGSLNSSAEKLLLPEEAWLNPPQVHWIGRAGLDRGDLPDRNSVAPEGNGCPGILLVLSNLAVLRLDMDLCLPFAAVMVSVAEVRRELGVEGISP